MSGVQVPLSACPLYIMDPVKILLLLSELEGSSAHLGNLGFEEDKEVLNEMKGRYYKLYFKLCKEQGRNPYG